MGEKLDYATEELVTLEEGEATHGLGRRGFFASSAATEGGLVAGSGQATGARTNTPEVALLGGAYDENKDDAYLGTILTFTGDPGTDPENPLSVELYDPGLLVVTRDGIIEKVEPDTHCAGRYNTYNYHGCVIMAGFVDTHVHYVQMDVIAAFGEEVLQWLEKYIYPGEKRFKDNEDYTREVVKFFFDTLLVNGTTTASVYCTQVANSTERFFEEAEKRNMRMLTGKMLMNVNADKDLLDKNVNDAINISLDFRTFQDQFAGECLVGVARAARGPGLVVANTLAPGVNCTRVTSFCR